MAFASTMPRLILFVTVLALTPQLTLAAAQRFLDQDAEAALQSLYSSSAAAKSLGAGAKGILVVPSMTRAGFLVATQAGAQSYAYALLFTDSDLAHLNRSGGWSLGLGPDLVAVNAGAAADISTTTSRSGVYAFLIEQKGLRAGIGLVGQKNSRFS